MVLQKTSARLTRIALDDTSSQARAELTARAALILVMATLSASEVVEFTTAKVVAATQRHG